MRRDEGRVKGACAALTITIAAVLLFAWRFLLCDQLRLMHPYNRLAGLCTSFLSVCVCMDVVVVVIVVGGAVVVVVVVFIAQDQAVVTTDTTRARKTIRAENTRKKHARTQMQRHMYMISTTCVSGAQHVGLPYDYLFAFE